MKRETRDIKVMSMLSENAYAVLIGDKKIENRSIPTKHRGVLFIHVSRSQTITTGNALHWNYQDALEEYNFKENNLEFEANCKKIGQEYINKQIPFLYPNAIDEFVNQLETPLEKWRATFVAKYNLARYYETTKGKLATGNIICAVNLIDCIDGEANPNNKYSDDLYYVSDYRYHYIFDKVVPLLPYKMNGLQAPIYSHNTDNVFQTGYFDACINYGIEAENLPEKSASIFDEENPVWDL